MDAVTRARVVLCAALVVTGVVLRCVGLGTTLLWHDEVYTRLFAAGYSSHDWSHLFSGTLLPVDDYRHYQRPRPDSSVVDTVWGLARDEPQHPPLYYVLVRLWVHVFGDGIASLRLPSVLSGLLLLPAAGWLGFEVTRSVRVAGYCIALAAVSPFFILYAQEAREYALWSVLLVLSTAALLRAARSSDDGLLRRGPWLGYALLVALALYTSFSTVSVLLAHIAYVVLRCRGRLTPLARHAVAALSISAVLFLPWAWMLLRHLEAVQASMAWSSAIVIPRMELVGTLLTNLSRVALDLGGEPVGGLAWAGVFGMVAVILTALWVLVARHPQTAALIGLLVLAPLLMLFGPDLLLGGIRSISTRYLTPTLAGLLVAMGALSETQRGERLLWGVLSICILGALHNTTNPAPWTKGISRGLPAIAATINTTASPVVIGNQERHHPGNILALSNILRDDARILVMPWGVTDDVQRPEDSTTLFLYSPLPQLLERLEAEGAVAERLYADLHAEVWRVHLNP